MHQHNRQLLNAGLSQEHLFLAMTVDPVICGRPLTLLIWFLGSIHACLGVREAITVGFLKKAARATVLI